MRLWSFEAIAARRAIVALLVGLVAVAGLASCSDADGTRGELLVAKRALETGQWASALEICEGPSLDQAACDVRWCRLLARVMLFTDELNEFLLPTFRSAEIGLPTGSLDRYVKIAALLEATALDVDAVVESGCSFDLNRLPVRIGEAADPVVLAESRGRWSTRSALLLGSIIDSVRYIFASTIDAAPTPPPPPGSDVPGLPALLGRIRESLAHQDALLASVPADPSLPQGGWLDRDHDGRVTGADELLLDLFEPGTERRIYDFAAAEMVAGEALPLGRLTPSEALPASACRREKWHVETLVESRDVGTTDGMSFSPDGRILALPIKVDGRYEIHLIELATRSVQRCLTCDTTVGWDDGVRWQPGGDLLVFVSSRDHPHFVGGAGGGSGQELYLMRADGSQQTRLTTSGAHATNYHVNWSPDGRRIVWGTTAERTWDVMVGDVVDDARGLRLDNVRRITHDTSWWETHGFTLDGRAVITTNTRAGWQSADLYAIDLASGAKTRLTDHPAWDEHAHLSPEGRSLSWISARWRSAGMQRLTDGSLSPVQDWFWIAPAILFSFFNPPAGFSTELTLMDADGSNLRRLTSDDAVVADNEWSPDGRQIVYRTTPNRSPRGPSSIRLLTFDDCD